ncbi:MAG: TetR family transcriptional regulator C-terminal domain-containing protein [Nitratireductor sp.]|nr:TetR family transcriptional regulator C-terminal domain-containing protein [Nitratireductor sp.]
MQARIIDAVVEMVAEKSISGTTLANVASAAGVSQGVLVFHFKSKEGLLTQAMVRLLEEYRQAWQPAMASADPLERIVGLVRADFDPAICTRKKLALWFAFWGETAAKPIYNRLASESEEERFQAMKHACEDVAGIARISDPVGLAQSIDAHTDGLWLQMHLQGSDFTREMGLNSALSHVRLLLPELARRI